MTLEEIFSKMQDMIAEQFALDRSEITMESSFTDDLGADSVDLVDGGGVRARRDQGGRACAAQDRRRLREVFNR